MVWYKRVTMASQSAHQRRDSAAMDISSELYEMPMTMAMAIETEMKIETAIVCFNTIP